MYSQKTTMKRLINRLIERTVSRVSARSAAGPRRARRAAATAIAGVACVLLSASADSRVLRWLGTTPDGKPSANGNAADTWTVDAGLLNWHLLPFGGRTAFAANDQVVFGDQGAVKTVKIVGDVTPTGVYVDTGVAYAFTGSGRIVGDAFLVVGEHLMDKQGRGELRIENVNAYRGDTELRSGRLVLAVPGALGSSRELRLVRGELRATGGTYTYSGEVSFKTPGGNEIAFSGSPLVFEGPATMFTDQVLRVAESAKVTFSQGLRAGTYINSVVKEGVGVLELADTIESVSLSVRQGELRLYEAEAFNVNVGGAGILKGDAVLAGYGIGATVALDVFAGGVVEPGVGSVTELAGSISAAGIRFRDASTLRLDLSGDGSDQLVNEGTNSLNLAGMRLDLRFHDIPQSGDDSYPIIYNEGGPVTPSSFHPEGSIVQGIGPNGVIVWLEITYKGLSGDDVELTVNGIEYLPRLPGGPLLTCPPTC